MSSETSCLRVRVVAPAAHRRVCLATATGVPRKVMRYVRPQLTRSSNPVRRL